MSELYIYGTIGEDFFGESTSAESVRDQLAEIGSDEPVNVRINSGGGDAFAGVAMRSLLERHNGPVDVTIDGLAASAASIVAMAGESIAMSHGSMMMIHEPWTFTIGDRAEHERTIGLLDKLTESLANIYSERSGQSAEAMRGLMAAETWFTAEEAVEAGLATHASQAEAAAWLGTSCFARYKQAPRQEQRTPDGRSKLSASTMGRALDLVRLTPPVVSG